MGLNACEQSLESENLIFGKLLAQKSKMEKERRRVLDMIVAYSETLANIESWLVEYSLQQQKYLKLRVNKQTKVDALQLTLANVKSEMKKYRDDIQALTEAATSLSQRKFDLTDKLKACMDEEI